MKKIKIVAVGNIKESFYKEAIDEYCKRLSRFCDLKIIELTEFSSSNGVEKEGKQILKNLSGTVILFDINGKEPTSVEFSKLIEGIYNCSDVITFVIGGSNGVSEKVSEQANHRISFGRVTYPHRLMRVIALEQIYRAFTISASLPYHK